MMSTEHLRDAGVPETADEEHELVDSELVPDVITSLRKTSSQSQSPHSSSSIVSVPPCTPESEAEEATSIQDVAGNVLPHHNIASDTDETISTIVAPKRARSSLRERQQAKAGQVHAKLRGDSSATPRCSSQLPSSDGSECFKTRFKEQLLPAFRAAREAHLPCGLALLCISLAIQVSYRGSLVSGDTTPAAIMVRHSADLLNRGNGVDETSITVLQDKLQLRQMQVTLDTQVFTAGRETARELIKSTCSLPEKICDSMVAAAGTKDMKFHKKSSVPLDSDRGSYNAVWMWAKEVQPGDLQVAFKAASISYQLRDVITYQEEIDDEPVIRCETSTKRRWWLGYETTEHCREVSRRKTITPMPVFKQSIMSPDEVQMVDTLMESMLAKRVLENTRVGNSFPDVGATSWLVAEAGH